MFPGAVFAMWGSAGAQLFPRGWVSIMQLPREDAWARPLPGFSSCCSLHRAVAGWGCRGLVPVPTASAQLHPAGSSFGNALSPSMSHSASPLVRRVQEVLLGVTALYLHLPSKGGGGVSAGPDTFRTFVPVSSLSLAPLGNADLVLISVIQPHWHWGALHSKNVSHCRARNLPLIWFFVSSIYLILLNHSSGNCTLSTRDIQGTGEEMHLLLAASLNCEEGQE